MASRPVAKEHPCEPVEPTGFLRTEDPVWEPAVLSIAVEGMVCRHCATRVRNALVRSPHVLGARVSLGRGVAEVLYDRARISPEALARVLEQSAHGTPRNYQVVAWSPTG